MRVLDVGSGAGDVALLLADLVGPRGRVVGIEQSDAILDTARARVADRRVAQRGLPRRGRAGGAAEAGFDAVVGRWVLMYQPDPVALLRQLATRLRPGGVAGLPRERLRVPAGDVPALRAVGAGAALEHPEWPAGRRAPRGPEMRMGTQALPRLPRGRAAGAAAAARGADRGGPDWPGYEYTAETLRSLLPVLQRLTGLDPAVIDIDTLADRLRQDAVDGQRVQMLPLMIGAWARRAA